MLYHFKFIMLSENKYFVERTAVGSLEFTAFECSQCKPHWNDLYHLKNHDKQLKKSSQYFAGFGV